MSQNSMQETMTFKIKTDDVEGAKEILRRVYAALQEKGYNPINQLVGYLISGDPAYITSYGNARTLICKVDRDELMEELLRYYLEKR